jgi:hypothetical protein
MIASFIVGFVSGVGATLAFAWHLSNKSKPEPAAFSYAGVSMASNRNQSPPQGVTMQSYNEKQIRDALKLYEAEA